MSSRLTMILAGLFLFAALLAGYWGLRLSRPAEPLPVPVAAPVSNLRQSPAAASALTGTCALPHRGAAQGGAGRYPITADDLLVEQLQVVPAGAYQQVEQVIGRSSTRPLAPEPGWTPRIFRPVGRWRE